MGRSEYAGVGLGGTMRGLRQAAAVAVAGVVSAAMLAAAALPASADGPLPAVWGATVKNTAKQTPLQAVQAFQTKAGRTLGATRDFLSWDSPFPTAYETGLAAQGTDVLLSVAAKRLNGAFVSWTAIGAAQPGDALYDDMVSWADRARDFGQPMWVTFQHEPEAATNKSQGNQATYIAAWRNWVSVFRTEGATNVRFLFITTAFGYSVKTTDRRYVPTWYPGDDVVDGIAVDAYNWYNCPAHASVAWQSVQQLIEGQRKFGLLHPDKELWIAEYGSIQDSADPSRQAQWIADAQALFQQPGYESYRGVLYYDLKKACDWRVETSPDTLAAFSTMGADPYYTG